MQYLNNYGNIFRFTCSITFEDAEISLSTLFCSENFYLEWLHFFRLKSTSIENKLQLSQDQWGMVDRETVV